MKRYVPVTYISNLLTGQLEEKREEARQDWHDRSNPQNRLIYRSHTDSSGVKPSIGDT